MNWINISEIKNHDEIIGKNILVWQNNLSDLESSRFQRGVFYKGNEKIGSFIKIYPNNSCRFMEYKEYVNYDLEGDECQITHFAIIEAPTI